MAVELRPMRDDELAAWLPPMRERYAADMVEQAGAPEEQATVKAAGATRLRAGSTGRSDTRRTPSR
jgi:hypothetical protein